MVPEDDSQKRFQKEGSRRNSNIRIGTRLSAALWLFKPVPLVYHGEYGYCQGSYLDILKEQRQAARERKANARAPQQQIPEPEDPEFEDHLLNIRRPDTVRYHRVDQSVTAGRLDDQGNLIGWRCPQIVDDLRASADGWPHKDSYGSTFSYARWRLEKKRYSVQEGLHLRSGFYRFSVLRRVGTVEGNNI